MPALAIFLSLDHARLQGVDIDGESMLGDMVAFVSGLLLGNDQPVRNWFAVFVRNGQKVIVSAVSLHLRLLVYCQSCRRKS